MAEIVGGFVLRRLAAWEIRAVLTCRDPQARRDAPERWVVRPR